MQRRLFCEISPFTYQLSVWKERWVRRVRDVLCHNKWATRKADTPLPVVVYRHKSLIRRRLGNVDMQLQNNKAVNLTLAAPKISGILIYPGETFSFWELVGHCTKAKGYLPGLTISNGRTGCGIGGGMCQFTNLLHWMILHSPLETIEYHHHNNLDLFPDYGRQIPFGTGTSIMYNYLDYRLYNPAQNVFQLIVSVEEDYLCGELRAEYPLPYTYHIREENPSFTEENGVFYRHNQIYRKLVDKATGLVIEDRLLMESHAQVLYDSKFINPAQIISHLPKGV